MTHYNERIWFRVIQCPECWVSLCCVNPRCYNYCPECGKFIYSRIREFVIISDQNAELRYQRE